MTQLALKLKAPRQRPAYHVTTPMTAEQMAQAVAAAECQEAAIVAIFRRHRGDLLTPSRVHEIGCRAGRRWLVTSVRRAMTNLTDEGLLVKTGLAFIGPHSRPENAWKLAE